MCELVPILFYRPCLSSYTTCVAAQHIKVSCLLFGAFTCFILSAYVRDNLNRLVRTMITDAIIVFIVQCHFCLASVAFCYILDLFV